MKRAVLIVAALCGCDGVSSHPLAPDGPASDAPIDDGPPTFARRYVIDRLIYPPTHTEAQDWSFDFDGDSTPDNQLGNMFVLLAEQGLVPQLRSDYAVNHGSMFLLAELASPTESFADGPATFTLFAGANPMPVPCTPTNSLTGTSQAAGDCGGHLQGTGTFDLSPISPRDPPLAGTLANGMLTTDPGRLHLSISFGDQAVALDLISARVQLTTTTAVGASGVIAGAVNMDQIEQGLVPALTIVLNAAIADECGPQCMCIPGSNGDTLRTTFAGSDCLVEPEELRHNALADQLLDTDVTIGSTDAASFAIRFTAVNATFTP